MAITVLEKTTTSSAIKISTGKGLVALDMYAVATISVGPFFFLCFFLLVFAAFLCSSLCLSGVVLEHTLIIILY